MIEVPLSEAQRELQSLAVKALTGEDVFIRVGDKRLRLVPSPGARKENGNGQRWGQGAWKGQITIPDEFYLPYAEDEIGEGKE